jgi:Flp pilus assembly protein TadB
LAENPSSSLLFLAVLGGLAAWLSGWVLARILISRFQNSLPSRFTRGSNGQLLLNPSHRMLALGLLPGIFIAAVYDLYGGFLLMAAACFLWVVIQKVPGWRQTHQARKRQEQMAEFFPQTLGMAIQALKTGQTVPQVVEYLSKECPTPLKEELATVRSEMDLGSSAEQALANMAERYPKFQEFNQFVESYKISRQTGANLTHLLQVLVDGLEEKNRLIRKMQAMTAQARLSGTLVGALPFILAAVFFVMDPNLMAPLFTEKMGWAILSLAVVLETIGFVWIRHLLRLEV